MHHTQGDNMVAQLFPHSVQQASWAWMCVQGALPCQNQCLAIGGGDGGCGIRILPP